MYILIEMEMPTGVRIMAAGSNGIIVMANGRIDRGIDQMLIPVIVLERLTEPAQETVQVLTLALEQDREPRIDPITRDQ